MICRGLLLDLERKGYIILPPRKSTPKNPFLNRKVPEKVEVDKSIIKTCLSDILPLNLFQVRQTPLEKLFNSLIAHHHYLGYTQPVGEHLKYLFFSRERVVGCFAWSSAVRHLSSRDRFIGWGVEMRKKNLHLIAYNTRFLIPEWVQVQYLASHLLSRCAKVISHDWQKFYNHPIYWLETFVDTERFKGTCYRAANWIYIGKTKGLGKNNHTGKRDRSIKSVWGFPLSKNFREDLQNEYK